jgi:hypothetical protein
MVFDFLEDLVHSLLVYDFVICGGYDEIIHVDFQPPLCNFFSENVVHHCLKGRGRVGKAEEHDCQFKEAFTCFEGGLSFVSLLDSDIVVAPSYIEL